MPVWQTAFALISSTCACPPLSAGWLLPGAPFDG
jgi:hypothetical protein